MPRTIMTKNANGTAERSRLVGGIVLVIVALVLFSGWMLRRGPVNVRAEKARPTPDPVG